MKGQRTVKKIAALLMSALLASSIFVSDMNAVTSYAGKNDFDASDKGVVYVPVYVTDGTSDGSNEVLAQTLGLEYVQRDGYYPVGVATISKSFFNKQGSSNSKCVIETQDDWNAIADSIVKNGGIDTSKLYDDPRDGLGNLWWDGYVAQASQNVNNVVSNYLDAVCVDSNAAQYSHQTALTPWAYDLYHTQGIALREGGREYGYHLDLRFETAAVKFVGITSEGNLIELITLDVIANSINDVKAANVLSEELAKEYTVGGFYTDDKLATEFDFSKDKVTSETKTIYVKLVDVEKETQPGDGTDGDNNGTNGEGNGTGEGSGDGTGDGTGDGSGDGTNEGNGETEVVPGQNPDGEQGGNEVEPGNDNKEEITEPENGTDDKKEEVTEPENGTDDKKEEVTEPENGTDDKKEEVTEPEKETDQKQEEITEPERETEEKQEEVVPEEKTEEKQEEVVPEKETEKTPAEETVQEPAKEPEQTSSEEPVKEPEKTIEQEVVVEKLNPVDAKLDDISLTYNGLERTDDVKALVSEQLTDISKEYTGEVVLCTDGLTLSGDIVVAGEYSGSALVKYTEGEKGSDSYSLDFKVTVDAYEMTIPEFSPSKDYDGKGFKETESIDGVNGESFTVTYETEEKNVGEHLLTITSDFTENYAVNFKESKLSITPKAVTITVADAKKTYGEADPKFRATVGKTVNNEKLVYEIVREKGENVGEYIIDVETPDGNLVDFNYAITVERGLLTVEKRNVVIEIDDAAKYVNEADPVLSGKVSNLAFKDTIDTLYFRSEGETVGTYTIDVWCGKGTNPYPNYNIIVKKGVFSILAKEVVAVDTPAANDGGDVATEATVDIASEPTPTAATPTAPVADEEASEETTQEPTEEETAEVSPTLEEATKDIAEASVPLISGDDIVTIEDEAVPEAAPSHCQIHWLILGLALLYAVYASVRVLQNKKELEAAGNVVADNQ